MQSRKVFFPFQPPLQPKVSKKIGKTTHQHEPLEVLNYTVYAMESTFLLKTFLTSIITSYQLLSRSASSCYTGIYSCCPTELLPCFLGFNIVIISWSFTVWLENTLQGLFSFGKAKWKANFLSPYMSENVSFTPIFNYSCLIIHVAGTADTTMCHNVCLVPPLCFSLQDLLWYRYSPLHESTQANSWPVQVNTVILLSFQWLAEE